MAKRILFTVAGILLIAFAAFWIYGDWAFANYPDKSVRRITGIQQYRVLNKTHTDFDWHEEIVIRAQDGEALLHTHPFKPGYANAVVAGLYVPEYLHDCLTCSYYFKKEPGRYDYLLLVLSQDRSHLLIYESFGD